MLCRSSRGSSSRAPRSFSLAFERQARHGTVGQYQPRQYLYWYRHRGTRRALDRAHPATLFSISATLLLWTLGLGLIGALGVGIDVAITNPDSKDKKALSHEESLSGCRRSISSPRQALKSQARQRLNSLVFFVAIPIHGFPIVGSPRIIANSFVTFFVPARSWRIVCHPRYSSRSQDAAPPSLCSLSA